jgi:hypothetical protein
MGTRAIYIIKDDETEIAVLYRQADGYPDAAGADIVKAIGGRDVVNGYTDDNQINGAGDMAVQLIAWMKHDQTVNATYKPRPINTVGNLYLHPPGTHGCGQSYTYTITCIRPREGRHGGVLVACDGHDAKDSFPSGPISDFAAWIEAAPWTEDDEDDEAAP